MASEFFWAITAYFNPADYLSRFENYHTFRDRLQIPLLTVEQSFGAEFSLSADDADVWLPVAGGDVMWQKERLLNLALEALPDHVTKVAWLDCDVVFANPDWVSDAEDLLDRAALIHLYDNVVELGPEDSRRLNFRRPVQPTTCGRSAIAAWFEGRIGPEMFAGSQRLKGYGSGFAWAARREVLAPTGFYDTCVLGSGNRVMVCAALGLYEEAIRYLCMNSRQDEHFRSWAEQHAALVDGEISALGGTVYHLWHGSLKNRRYAERHIDFAQHGFDPTTDITTSDTGCWQWNSDKPAMHQYVRSYFASRDEDADPAM